MIDVVAPAGPYRAAIAELPLSVRLGDRAIGAIVIVPGKSGWVSSVRAAVEAGAAGVVVADPVLAPAGDLRLLAERTRVPVIVERPLLRADAAADARATRAVDGTRIPPRAVVLDGAASAAHLGVVARDAVGWGRTLAGQPLSLIAAERGLALMEDATGIAVTLSVVATRRPGRGWIRAQALGEAITDVAVEGRVFSVAVSTAEGRLSVPTRFESSERLALRCAVAAVAAGDLPGDLAELAADTDSIERMMFSPA